MASRVRVPPGSLEVLHLSHCLEQAGFQGGAIVSQFQTGNWSVVFPQLFDLHDAARDGRVSAPGPSMRVQDIR